MSRRLLMGVWQRFKAWAARLKRDVEVLALALFDPRTPWPAKALAGLIVAYALSPIDLIPDFIPVLGLLDEMILLPLLIVLVLRLIPAPVLVDCRERVEMPGNRLPSWLRWSGLTLIVALWLVMAMVFARWCGLL